MPACGRHVAVGSRATDPKASSSSHVAQVAQLRGANHSLGRENARLRSELDAALGLASAALAQCEEPLAPWGELEVG
jgi:hypothetical protein